jgi:hypothetical protein
MPLHARSRNPSPGVAVKVPPLGATASTKTVSLTGPATLPAASRNQAYPVRSPLPPAFQDTEGVYGVHAVQVVVLDRHCSVTPVSSVAARVAVTVLVREAAGRSRVPVGGWYSARAVNVVTTPVATLPALSREQRRQVYVVPATRPVSRAVEPVTNVVPHAGAVVPTARERAASRRPAPRSVTPLHARSTVVGSTPVAVNVPPVGRVGSYSALPPARSPTMPSGSRKVA